MEHPETFEKLGGGLLACLRNGCRKDNAFVIPRFVAAVSPWMLLCLRHFGMTYGECVHEFKCRLL